MVFKLVMWHMRFQIEAGAQSFSRLVIDGEVCLRSIVIDPF
jgi:hypothetical protein